MKVHGKLHRRVYRDVCREVYRDVENVNFSLVVLLGLVFTISVALTFSGSLGSYIDSFSCECCPAKHVRLSAAE